MNIANHGDQGGIDTELPSLIKPLTPKEGVSNASPTTIVYFAAGTGSPRSLEQVPTSRAPSSLLTPKIAPSKTWTSFFLPSLVQKFVVSIATVATQLENWILRELPNQVTYSETLIDISEGTQDLVPKIGEIHAGTLLRTELAETAMDIMLSSFQKKGCDGGFIDLEKDLNRSNFTLQDLKPTKQNIDEPEQRHLSLTQLDTPSLIIGIPGSTPEQVEEGMKLFKQFIGSEHADCANAVARIMNQTLFSSSEALGSGSARELPTKGITRSQHQKFHDTDILYYASNAGGNCQVSYTLKKETEGEAKPLYFLLEAVTAGPSQYLFLTQNTSNPDKVPLALCMNKSLTITQKTSNSYKIIPNPTFDAQQKVTAENFPCAIECLAFFHHYSIDPVAS